MTSRPARWLLMWVGLLAGQCAFAQGSAPSGRIEASEPSVKAAFLYKFANYVEWPPNALPAPDAPFVIGVLGSDEVAAELEKIVPGRAVHNHPAVVRRLREGDPIAGVQMLFVGRGQPNLRAILHAAQQQATLTVTESERGLEGGSVINFVVADQRVGFEVSLEAAERSGLKVSSRMLNVARRVVSRP